MKKRLLYLVVISVFLISCRSTKNIVTTLPSGDDWYRYTLRLDSLNKPGKNVKPAQLCLLGNIKFEYVPKKEVALTIDDSGRYVVPGPIQKTWDIPTGTYMTFDRIEDRIIDSLNDKSVRIWWFKIATMKQLSVPFSPSSDASDATFSILLTNIAEVKTQPAGQQYGKTRLSDKYLYKFLMEGQTIMCSFAHAAGTSENQQADGSLVPGRQKVSGVSSAPESSSKKKSKKKKAEEVPEYDNGQ